MIKIKGEKLTPAQLIRNILVKHVKEAIHEAYSFEEYLDDPDKLTEKEKEKIIKTMEYQMIQLRYKMKIPKSELVFMWEL